MKYTVRYSWTENDGNKYSWEDHVEAKSGQEAIDKTVETCEDMCKRGFVVSYNIEGVE